MLQYIFIILLICLCMVDNIRLVKRKDLPHPYMVYLQGLLLFHMAMVLVFSYYIGKEGGDSKGYWELTGPLAHPNPSSWWDYFGVGYPFMYWLNYIPSKVLNWSWWTGNMIYGLVGYFGFRFLSNIVFSHYTNGPKLRGLPIVLALLYLPNLHFWTAGVGKEAICFWALAALLFALSKKYSPKYLALGLFALLIVFMVRTYLAAIIVLVLVLVLTFDFKFLTRSQQSIFIFALLILGLSLPAFYWYSGIKDMPNFNPFDISKYQIEMLSGEGIGSSVPMLDYSQPMRLITYWFRPFIWVVKDGFMLGAAAIENSISIILVIFLLFKAKWRPWRSVPLFIRFALVLFVLSSILYANSLGNMGIMMRMKAPYMLLLLLSIAWMYKEKTKETSSRI